LIYIRLSCSKQKKKRRRMDKSLKSLQVCVCKRDSEQYMDLK